MEINAHNIYSLRKEMDKHNKENCNNSENIWSTLS
jgi:hypothetical protein